MSPNRLTWTVTQGAVGMVAQTVGLAEAVGFPIEQKTVTLARPWRWLPARYWPKGIFGLEPDSRATFAPPWPDLVISCGRKSVGPALAVKRAALKDGKQVRLVAIQNPRMSLRDFDMVTTPEHDRLSGENVVSTLGAVHRVNRALLERHRPTDSASDGPVLMVSIGGESGAYHLPPDAAERMARSVRDAAERMGARLLVTASRRTSAAAEAALRAVLTGPKIAFWDGSGENPYFRYLATADAILATGDSVNMVSEACSAGKPVYLLDMPVRPGRGGAARKFDAFHDSMISAGYLRRFQDGPRFRFDLSWAPPPLDESARVAALIRPWFS